MSNFALFITQSLLIGAVLFCTLTFRIKSRTVRLPPRGTEMRGLQRLATVTQSVLKDMDDEAGKVADDLTAAQADSQVVISGFQAFVGEIKANTARVKDVLNQLTNGAPAGPLPDTAVSPSSAAPVPPPAS